MRSLVGISDRIFRIPTNYFRIPVIHSGITILSELFSIGIGPSVGTFVPNQFPITLTWYTSDQEYNLVIYKMLH